MSRGFTFIELLLVISIIGILSSIVLATLGTSRGESRDTSRFQEVRELQKTVFLYQSDHGGNTPFTGGSLGTYCVGENDGDTCWAGFAGGSTYLKNALGPYISGLPVDPLPGRGIGDTYLYMYGVLSKDCTIAKDYYGEFIVYEPDSGIANAQSCSVGVPACCSTASPTICTIPTGTYFCALQLQ